MQKITIGSMVGLGAVLLALGACHNRPGTRSAADDHDGDQDEHSDEHRAHHREHDRDHHDGDRPQLGAGLSTGSAVRAIANARCDREQRCGNIGADKDFSSMNACEDKIRADWADDLNKYECPKGTVKAALDACLTEIRGEECGRPFQALSRMMKCSASDICDD